MGRQRDPRRDEAWEIYKSANGEINLTEIASQLNISDGTVRGWKAKDSWEKKITGVSKVTKRSDEVAKEHITTAIEDESLSGEDDELFIEAVRVIAEAKQASVSLLQRRMRIGYTRSARLIDAMERKKLIGPYQGDKPREVYATVETVNLLEQENTSKKRNAPKKQLERSINKERSEMKKVVPVKIVETETELLEVPDDEGLTHKQRIFIVEYLRDFNATRAAIAAGYSKKTAHSIGWENLRKPEIQAAISKYNETMINDIGMNAQRVLLEYMKIAFADITDYVDFGQKEEDLLNDNGEQVLNPETGEPEKYKYNFVSFRNSDEVDGTLISEVKKGKDGVSVKLYDKTKALEVLTKYMDLLPDQHKRMIQDEKLKMQREKLDIDKMKATGEGNSDNDLIDDWVEAVTGDESGGKEETSSI